MKAAAVIGLELVKHVEKLSEMKIVHGDIFQRNVGFTLEGDIVLIDFGRAMIVTNASPIAQFSFSSFPLFSPWEMVGYHSSYRDDLFRILRLMGFVMNGVDYLLELERLSKEPMNRATGQPLFNLKTEGFLFESDGIDSRPV